MIIQGATEKAAMLAAIIESSDDAIISKNLNGTITSWNKGAEGIFGYTEAETIGKHISILIPRDRLSEEDMIISKLQRGEKIEHYQTIRLTKTGREVHISLSISPLRNEDGQVIGASKIARDITKEKEAEKLTAQYIRRLELLNSTGKILSADLDLKSILQKVADATTELSGAAFGAFFYYKIESNGEPNLLYAVSGVSKKAFDDLGIKENTPLFDLTFKNKRVVRFDNIVKDFNYRKNLPANGIPEKETPLVSYLAVPLFSQTGVVIGGLFFGHSKTGVFTAEHQILVEAIASQAGIALQNAALYNEVQNLNARKDEFIGFTSHELKTPLTTISGYLQIMENTPETHPQILPKLKKQVSRLSRIISDLLDISKIQAGKFELFKTTFSLTALIKDCVETARQLSSDHEVEIRLPTTDVMIYVDATKISQVIINLLSNAFKYSPANKNILLVAETIEDEVKISVIDKGIGIPKEHLDKIFTQFYRISQGKNDIPGVGLGLYLCKEFIEAHRGKIWAESEPGNGTCVNIVFPANKRQ
jgi:PAS domain S-box-containing protein